MKKVFKSLYVHKSNIDELGEDKKKIVEEREKLIGDFSYDIIKFDTNTENISFIACPEFDKVHEPLVGDSIITKKNGKIRLNKSKGQIYHMKYLFVDKNYQGFDIEEEKKRAEKWNELLKNYPDSDIKSKIGWKKNWEYLLKWMNMEE